MNNLPKFVERLEQKKRIHDMSAQVLVDVEALENQQVQVVGCCKDNKQLLGYIREGMKNNLEIIKKNIAYLKSKSSTNNTTTTTSS